MTATTTTRRPRNADAPGLGGRILYGDWGTSKAYDWHRVCRGRLQFVLVDRGHVSAHRPGGSQLHGHLQALSRRRRGVCQRAASFGNHFHCRRFLADRRLHCHGGHQCGFRLCLSGRVSSGCLRRCCHRLHRRAELLWTQAHRRPGLPGFAANRGGGPGAGGLLPLPPRRCRPQFAAPARRFRQELGWICRSGSGLVRRRGDCQFHRRDETQ